IAVEDYVQAVRDLGYAVVEDVLGEAQVESLRQAFIEAEAVAAPRRSGSALFAVRRALAIPAVRAEAESGTAARLAADVLGTEAKPVRAILFDKNPEANWKVAWHQDQTIAVKERDEVEGFGPWSVKGGIVHVQPPAAVLEQMVTVRLHLDPCPAENGALRVLPGTHARGKLTPTSLTDIAQDVEPVTCAVGLGGAVLMRPLIVHGSSPSQVAQHRRVVHIEYAASALPGGLTWAIA
ncbi:MAG: phytanoyl-CoA dioxygenase family protein, partial [Bacteroidota bacterium]